VDFVAEIRLADKVVGCLANMALGFSTLTDFDDLVFEVLGDLLLDLSFYDRLSKVVKISVVAIVLTSRTTLRGKQ